MNRTIIIALFAAAALALSAATAAAQGINPTMEITYLGKWSIEPNGDVNVVMTYDLPQMLYGMWKQSGRHIQYLRNFHPHLSVVEASRRDAQWDDINRRLTITLTVHGLTSNRGDHWEARVMGGPEFVNIDEGKKTAFFTFMMTVPEGVVKGQDVIRYPDAATDLNSRKVSNKEGHVLSYRLADSAGSAGGGGGRTVITLFAGLACLAGAIALFIRSGKMPA